MDHLVFNVYSALVRKSNWAKIKPWREKIFNKQIQVAKCQIKKAELSYEVLFK